MPDVELAGAIITVTADDMVGEGGEAEVFKLDANTVLKIFKDENHPAFAGADATSAALRDAAHRRLIEHQTKLADFPRGLPKNVMVPQLLAHKPSDKQFIIGYSMDLVENAVTLRDLCQRQYRQTCGITNADVIEAFRRMHDTISAIHARDVVIGDFNSLNVLVCNREPFLLDTDSMQFGPYVCVSYTERYVDPLICDPQGDRPMMAAQHNRFSDWYAFALLFFEAMLFVHPYGGVYKPRDPANKVGLEKRSLRRISVLHPEVVYPKAALPLTDLGSELLEYYKEVLENDLREPFPNEFLEEFRHTGKVMRPATPSRSVSGDRSDYLVRTSFYTDGVLLAVSLDGSRLRYIYHHDGVFCTQDGSALMKGSLRPDIRFHCVGDYVVAICGSQALLFREGKNVGRLNVDRYRLKEAAISGNCSSLYFASGGRLWRQVLPKDKNEKTLPAPQDLGDVLQGQTKVFAGYEFGFAFYLAGQFRRAFIFDLDRGLRTPVDITPLSGDIIDVDFLFGNRSLWLLVSAFENGKLVNRCACIDNTGSVQAVAWAEDGDNSWLGSLRGKTVATYEVNGLSVDTLLASTADGVVQVQCLNNRLKQTKVYANTENLVSQGENILFSPAGLYVIDSHRIDLITTTPGG